MGAVIGGKKYATSGASKQVGTVDGKRLDRGVVQSGIDRDPGFSVVSRVKNPVKDGPCKKICAGHGKRINKVICQTARRPRRSVVGGNEDPGIIGRCKEVRAAYSE